jgi:phage-related protein
VREIKWNKEALAFVRGLSESTKREIGSLLMLLQFGINLGPPQAKPMKIIHKNAFELRVKDEMGNYRIIYIVNQGDKILIPHAFNKKTQKTAKFDIQLSIKRLKEMIHEIK